MATRKTTAKAKEPTAPTTEENNVEETKVEETKAQEAKVEEAKVEDTQATEETAKEPTAPKAEKPTADEPPVEKPKQVKPKQQAKPQTKATGKEYQCMWQVNHNGKAHMAGETINLDPQTAKDLLEGGAIKELA